MGPATLKAALMKATQAKSAPKASVAPRAGVPPKPRVPSGTAMSKTSTVVNAQRAGVTKISTRVKKLAVALWPLAKGKQARVDVGLPLAFATPHKVLV
jgi:hypothetical protein